MVKTFLRTLIGSSHTSLGGMVPTLAAQANRILRYTKPIQQQRYYDLNAPARRTWIVSPSGKLVYDLGANNGRNIPYYLSRNLHVVAVEANPKLAESISNKYKANGNVEVLNACILPEGNCDSVEFYIHKTNDVLSTTVPHLSELQNFQKISVPATTPTNLFGRFGSPFYLKMDLEGLDGPVLKSALLALKTIPYVSAEIHSIEPFCHLVSSGYEEFKVVEGRFVGGRYYDLPPGADYGQYAFSIHDAGPFGEDVPGDWMSADQTFEYLGETGLGWKDVHARKLEP